MTKWSINLPAAKAIVASVSEQAAELDTHAQTLASAINTVTAELSESPNTKAALETLAADPFLVTLASMQRHVTNVATTTEGVIGYYERADYDMAASTQATMKGVSFP